MPAPAPIVVSAVAVRDGAGALLTVRKRGTSMFMFPGGKPEPGETALDAAIRECYEEIGLRLTAPELRVIGEFRAAAANEDGHEVVATVYEYLGALERAVAASAEIVEHRWVDLGSPAAEDIAPLTVQVMPLLAH